MKKSLLFSFLFLIILLMACSKKPIIVQENIESETEDSIQFIEETIDEKEHTQYLELTYSNKLITLDITQIPILSNFLSQHNDKDKAIQDMNLIQVLEDAYDSLYLLSFACQDDTCSYLFLNTELDDSHLLADQAELIRVEPSPDLSKVLFVFGRNHSDKSWSTNKLVVYDVEACEEIILTGEDGHFSSLHAFRFPILAAEWPSESEIEVSLPLIDEPSIELLNEWFAKEGRSEQQFKLFIN